MDGVSDNDRGGGGRRGGAQRPLHGNSFISKDLDREFPFHFLISRLHSPTFLFYILPACPAHPSVRPSVRPPTRPPPLPPSTALCLLSPFCRDVAARSLKGLGSARRRGVCQATSSPLSPLSAHTLRRWSDVGPPHPPPHPDG